MDEVLEKVDAGDYDKVVLLPLMIVAGDHASNDMAGDSCSRLYMSTVGETAAASKAEYI